MRVALILVLLASPVAAQTEDPAYNLCVTQTEGYEARTACIAEWRRAAAQVVAYGRAAGHIDATGEVDWARFAGAMFGWKQMLGLPPQDPFLRCVGRVPLFGPQDLRTVWACIKRFDPKAALSDAI